MSAARQSARAGLKWSRMAEVAGIWNEFIPITLVYDGNRVIVLNRNADVPIVGFHELTPLEQRSLPLLLEQLEQRGEV